jgi:spermidine/putrescine transport system substrate-binding protein
VQQNSRVNPAIRRRSFLAGGAALGAGLLLSGCGSSTSKADTGKVGGTLRYLGFEGEDDRDAVASFLGENKVKLESSYIPDNASIITKIKTGGEGRYDVVAQNDRYFATMIDLDMLEPLDMSLIPNAEKIYTSFATPPWAARDGKTYAVAAWFGFETLNYRADLVDPKPTSFDIIADDRYKGKYAIRSDATNNILDAGEFIFNYGIDGSKYTQEMLSKVLDFYRTVKPNAKTFATSFGELTDLLVRGDVWIGSPGWEYIDVQAKEQNVDVSHWLRETGPLPAWTDAFAIVKGSQNVATAHAWINAMLAPKAMAETATKLGTFVSNKEAPALMDDKVTSLMGFDSLDANLERAIWGVQPPLTQSDSNYATLDDFNTGWAEIWGA